MIRVRDLRVDYDNVCAVHDLTLEIGPGEVFGLIGPNGAGKTSTMRAIVGLLEPTYGDIELAGVDIRERPEDASQVLGFMPDFPPVYDDLLVWEFLDLWAASYWIAPSERPGVVERYLDMVGLTEKRNAIVTELSRGMRQRLVLAKTLVPQPQVLLLDEPASGMDPHGRADLKKVLRTLAAEGKTVLVSSHILSEMSEFCTSVGIMERGRMVVSGRVDDVMAEVMGHGTLLVEVLGPTDEFQRVVGQDARVGSITRKDNTFQFAFHGDVEAASDLLRSLIQSGVRVASFARRREGLEDLFLKVGAKELS